MSNVSNSSRATLLADAQRLVVKVGSSLITGGRSGLDLEAIDNWARQIASMQKMGKQVLLVSSGAIACGVKRLGWQEYPRSIHEIQAVAALGQMGLIQTYESIFTRYGIKSAQILLTHDDMRNRTRYLNARSTLNSLLQLDILPIVNENDSVVTEEIRFGDNDTLGALVTNLVEADALLLLTDQSGLYSADPRRHKDARLVHEEMADSPQLESMAGRAGTRFSHGGMLTKVRAARRAARSGAHTLIADGRLTDVLLRLLQGEMIGTLLRASTERLAARKQWLADHLQLAGHLLLDEGAVKALYGGKSLLPVGVTGVEGEFKRGAVLACLAPGNGKKEIARGLVNYSSQEVRRVAGKPSGQIENILGYIDEAELIHRDNMVLTAN